MRRRWMRCVVALVAASISACGPEAPPGTDAGRSDDAGPGVDAGPPVDAGPGVDAGNPADAAPTDAGPQVDAQVPPAGEASLSFEPRFGSGTGRYIASEWGSPLETLDGAGALVLMLCASADPTCESPLLTRAITESETDGDPIQGSFGPSVVATELPAGTYRLMLFSDNPRSAELGYAWDDNFATRETAWGGRVSEWDAMLADPSVSPDDEVNPPPLSVTVELTDGATTDLGVVLLSHVHERDVSPVVRPEAGRLVVATETGVRLVDLDDYRMIRGPSGYDHPLSGPGGAAFSGSVCGVVPGAGSVVWVLHSSGEAVPFDAQTGAQLHGGNHVLFSGGSGPCRGLFAETSTGRPLLFVTARGGSSRRPAMEALWVADLSGVASTAVTAATRYESEHDAWLDLGADSLAFMNDVLFVTVSERGTVPIPELACRGRHCALEFPVDPSDGTLGVVSDFYVGPEIDGGYDRDTERVPCTETGDPGLAGLAAARFHDGRDLLFIGGCTEIVVYDLGSGAAIDFGAFTGVQGLDATIYGNGFTEFMRSPDGDTLWAIPTARTQVPMNYELGPGGPRETFNRFMAFPIDLSTGAQPAVAAEFATEDIDGFAGVTTAEPYATPGIDPGLHLNFGQYVRDQVRWAPSTAGSTFGIATLASAPTFVVTQNALIVRGSGNSGVSGLGKAGNLAVFDLEAQRAVLFPNGSGDYYPYWGGGVDADERFGIDLRPEDDAQVSTEGIAYVPG